MKETKSATVRKTVKKPTKKVATTAVKKTGYLMLSIDYREADGFWRKVVVPADASLEYLHLVIQSAFGLLNYHDFGFNDGKHDYIPDGYIGIDEEITERYASETKIGQIFKKVGTKVEYTYDSGDLVEFYVQLLDYADGIDEDVFGTSGPDLVEDSAGFNYTPGICYLLTDGKRTAESKECVKWLKAAFNKSPADVLREPTVAEIFKRVKAVKVLKAKKAE